MNATPYLYAPVGIPACGKSKFAAELLVSLGESRSIIEVVSTDVIREELTGDATNQDANNLVFKMFHWRIRTALELGKNVYADATNLKPSSRRKLLDIAFDTAAHPVALRFADSEDFDLCQSRNLARDRVVPEHVMVKFHKLFMVECATAYLAAEGWEVQSVL